MADYADKAATHLLIVLEAGTEDPEDIKDAYEIFAKEAGLQGASEATLKQEATRRVWG